jgi:predicted site-specific integrase-resolvase
VIQRCKDIVDNRPKSNVCLENLFISTTNRVASMNQSDIKDIGSDFLAFMLRVVMKMYSKRVRPQKA